MHALHAQQIGAIQALSAQVKLLVEQNQALRKRVDVLEAVAAALRRKCDDQAHDLSYARETGASAAQGSDARIARLERELAAARAHHEEAARAHAADAESRATPDAELRRHWARLAHGPAERGLAR